MKDDNTEIRVKETQEQEGWLNGKLLIAMPDMRDPRFDQSVIFICSHDEKGAMGLIVNKRADNINLDNMLEDLKISPEDRRVDMPIMMGGPVETTRGFLLHSIDHSYPDTIVVEGKYGLTNTVDALKETVYGQGPSQHLFALGHAGWSAGQLEREIQTNAWLVADAHDDVIFAADDALKWSQAVSFMGINPLMLSAQGGQA